MSHQAFPSAHATLRRSGRSIPGIWSRACSTLYGAKGSVQLPEGDEWFDISRSERSNDSAR